MPFLLQVKKFAMLPVSLAPQATKIVNFYVKTDKNARNDNMQCVQTFMIYKSEIMHYNTVKSFCRRSKHMDIWEKIELFECMVCGGPGLLEEVHGQSIYATCLDCGCQTAEFPFRTPEEREEAAQQAATMWNVGKVIKMGVGE